jgi:AcrR family transcriptional regulator
MSTGPAPEPPSEPRLPLSRARVLDAAITLADREGIGSLTMRRLAQAVGVEAMSLYHHVANKEALLDGVVEVIMGEIEASVAELAEPSGPDGWKASVRARILAARGILLRHPWVPGVIESRTGISPPTMRYYDGLLGTMRHGGFSYDLAHHAMHALGSRALGFTQELFEPDDQGSGGQDVPDVLVEMADQLPNLMEMMSEVAHDDPESTLGWCDDQFEFEFGLDLILDGLDRLRSA